MSIETGPSEPAGRIIIPIEQDLIPQMLGPNDLFLRFLEKKFASNILVKESMLILEANALQLKSVIEEMLRLCQGKGYLEMKDVETIVRLYKVNSSVKVNANGSVVLENPQVLIRTRTANQAKYFQALQENELVFSIGPAGTGKTFLAVAWAVALFERGDVERIVLVKPVVEAGEKLGFLPGDIKEKVDPYFKPLYDALLFMMSPEKVRKLIERSEIEIAPLAYMRGRTLNNAITILDEAQNTTAMQMKMFLTRLGIGSRSVITGDITQIDLDNPQKSGLLKVEKILQGIKNVKFVYLDASDVIRHKLVSDIIKAYDEFQDNND